MHVISEEEILRADEVLDELQGLGQIRFRIPKPRKPANQQREQAAAAAQRACGYETGALRQADSQRTLAANALAQAARVIPDAVARRKALLAQAQAHKAAAKDWEDRAAQFGRQCRPAAKAFTI